MPQNTANKTSEEHAKFGFLELCPQSARRPPEVQCAEALQAEALALPEGALSLLQAYLTAVFDLRGTPRARGPEKRTRSRL